MKKSRLLGAVCLCLSSGFSQAATITYSGADLFNDPNVSFPTLTPTLNGTSLVFGTGATVRYQKLLELPLFPAGSLSTTSPTSISISINLTRLPCVTSAGCAGGEDDSDHHFALGDGTNLVGGAASDGIGGAGTASTYTDRGDSAGLTSGQVIFTNAGYPAIGSSFDVNLDFTLDTGTTMDLSFLGGQETAGLQGLFRFAPIDFVFLKEGDPGEQYQVNTLAITSDALSAVPIPPALWLFGSGLLGLIGVARRKNNGTR
jgi:hypothetical protein